jgi:hypothetical protein
MPVKRGIADATVRLYNERALLKYDTESHAFRFADVIELTHPRGTKVWQGALFKYALDRRHGRAEENPELLPVLHANRVTRKMALADTEVLTDSDALRSAGMTWEDTISLAGSKEDKKALWEAQIPNMGYMALLRNLRNFEQAGISAEVANQVIAKLADPDEVTKSKQFPFRFLSAFKAVGNLRWAYALDQALTASLANIPELPGRTLILVDRSGSMFSPMAGEKSELQRAEAAAIFGAALAARNQGRADLVQYGTSWNLVPVGRGESLLNILKKFGNLGGTSTWAAVRANFKGHDRIVIVTDEQAHDSMMANYPVPIYTWNLGGYRLGHASGAANHYTFGGLTDLAFKLIPLLEAGRDGEWPF